jgi:hypothetical protein
MKSKKKIDWKSLWKAFNKWYNGKTEYCSECGRLKQGCSDKEWEDQQAKIQELVNKQLGP